MSTTRKHMPDYIGKIVEMLLKEVDRPYKFSVYDAETFGSIDQAVSEGKIVLPAIFLFEEYKYDTRIEEVEVKDVQGESSEYVLDYRNALPVQLTITFHLLTGEQDQIRDIERFIRKYFEEAKTIDIPIDDNLTIPVLIHIKENVYAQRGKIAVGGLEVFRSVICTEPCTALSYDITFDPFEVSYDEELKRIVLERMVFLYKKADALVDKLPYSYALKESHDYTQDEKHLIEIIEQMRKHAKEIGAETQILPEERLNSFDTIKILDLMNENRWDLQTALSYFDEHSAEYYSEMVNQNNDRRNHILELKKTEESKINREQAYKSSGDPEVNKYIDAIVRNIKVSLETSGVSNVNCYGGSNYMEYFDERDNGSDVKLPAVIVSQTCNFRSEDDCSYTFIDTNGHTVKKYYGQDAFRMVIDVISIKIQGETEENVKQIKDLLIKRYERPLPIGVQDTAGGLLTCNVKNGDGKSFQERDFENHSIVLKTLAKTAISTFSDVDDQNEFKKEVLPQIKSTTSKSLNREYCEEQIYLAPIIAVYHPDYKLNKNLVKSNQAMQTMTLKLAYECNDLFEKYEKLKFFNDYESFLNGKRVFLSSKQYKRLLNDKLNKKPIDRDLFEEVFSTIVFYRPQLFDDYIQNTPIAELKKAVIDEGKFYSKMSEYYYGLLNYPATIDVYNEETGNQSTVNIRDTYAIHFIWEEMEKDATCDLQTAINYYIEYYKWKEAKDLQKQIEAEERAQYGDDSDSDTFIDKIFSFEGRRIKSKFTGAGSLKDGEVPVCQNCANFFLGKCRVGYSNPLSCGRYVHK